MWLLTLKTAVEQAAETCCSVAARWQSDVFFGLSFSDLVT